MSDEKKRFTTPRGELIWPRLTEPSFKFKKEGDFSTQIAIEPSEKLTELCQEIELIRDEYVTELKKKEPKKYRDVKIADLPFKPEKDDEGEPTGRIIFSMHCPASGINKKTGKEWRRENVPMYDSHGETLDPDETNPWSGTIARVACNPFCTFVASWGAGVTLYLDAVQIIKLVSGGARSASDYGFGEEEEGYGYVPDRGEEDAKYDDDVPF